MQQSQQLAHILVPLSSQPSDASTLAQALQVASLLRANTQAALAQSDPADVMMWTAEGTYSGISANLVESAWKGADEAWARTQEIVNTFHLDAPTLSLERIVGPIVASLVKRAALAELTVFSCEDARGKGLLSGVLESLVIDAHAPVLVARASAEELPNKIKGGAMIAWNGSVEAARAVKAALPILAVCEKVVIAQAGAHEENIRNAFHAPAYLQGYLAQRGITCDLLHVEGTDAPHAILNAAKSHQIGLLVAGAWGHSRAREFVFGGATRTFLKDATSPSLLLCH